MKKEIIVEATEEELIKVNDFIGELLASHEYSDHFENQLFLVVEEIFVNISRYAYNDKVGRATIKGQICGSPPEIKLQFIDEGIPYNPLEKPDPNVDAGLKERKVGGLGIFLVKNNVDNITYERRNDKNILTIKKKIV